MGRFKLHANFRADSPWQKTLTPFCSENFKFNVRYACFTLLLGVAKLPVQYAGYFLWSACKWVLEYKQSIGVSVIQDLHGLLINVLEYNIMEKHLGHFEVPPCLSCRVEGSTVLLPSPAPIWRRIYSSPTPLYMTMKSMHLAIYKCLLCYRYTSHKGEEWSCWSTGGFCMNLATW